MQRSLRLSLSVAGAAALALASAPIQPIAAQEDGSAADLGVMEINLEDGSAADLGVMEINLKDAIQFNWGFQGALQGAGTPNQAGIGALLPIVVGENSVLFIDALANANFFDRDGESSIINTDVAGTTISTSTRLGYRWLNGDRSWMYGLNAGYDSRPVKSGGTDTRISVNNKRTLLFQQIALNAEAVSNDYTLNLYGLLPVGDVEQRLNSFYQAGAMNTYGLDVGYLITPALKASAGYYYQHRDQEHVDGSGVHGRLAYEISNGLTAGVNISYDEAFDTRVSGDLKVRFGGPKTTTQRKEVQQQPVISALTSTPSNRDIRVHDWLDPECKHLTTVERRMRPECPNVCKFPMVEGRMRPECRGKMPSNCLSFGDYLDGVCCPRGPMPGRKDCPAKYNVKTLSQKRACFYSISKNNPRGYEYTANDGFYTHCPLWAQSC
jgi:hypothetical protein